MKKENTGHTVKIVRQVPKVHKKNFQKLIAHLEKNGDNK